MTHEEAQMTETNDYEVGYKKPPKATQFKKGQSGNPKGRPKRSRNMSTLLKEELSQTVWITEQGKRRQATKAEVMSKRLVQQAMEGNMHAIKTLLNFSASQETDQNEPLFHLMQHDQDVLANFMSRQEGGHEHSD